MSKYYHTSNTKVCTPNNIKAVRDKLTGCEYKCRKTIERFYHRGDKLVGGEVIAFILDDGEIFSIDRVEEVLWIDTDKQEHWIFSSEYIGYFQIPEDFDETYADKLPERIRHSIKLLEYSIL